MKGMFGKLWVQILIAIGMTVGTIAAFGQTLQEWNEVLKPGFIFASIGAVASNLINFLMGRNKENGNG